MHTRPPAGKRIARRLLHLGLLLAALPFLLADSCVRRTFVLYEYDLDKCPARSVELPAHVSFGGWRLDAGEPDIESPFETSERHDAEYPYCHGFIYYELTEEKSAKVFSEPVRDAVVYARLRYSSAEKAPKCRLEVVSNLACNPHESVEDCEARMPYHGVMRTLKPRAGDYTDVVAQRLLIGLPFIPKTPPARETLVGPSHALEDWCAKN